MADKVNVAVLGATGMIGQRFVEMLEDHPYFDVEGLYASARSDGKRFGETLRVRDYPYKEETLDRKIAEMDLDRIAENCDIAFSGIPSGLAGPTEAELAAKGVKVFSNAGAHRMDAHVPIIVPEVNPEQFDSVKDQPGYKESGGYIVTNANCASTGIIMPLKALKDKYGLEQVFVSTYQAISGAGYPGVPSLDIFGNVKPYISNEEEKMETEVGKMLGTYHDGGFDFSSVEVMANCARVPVIDGHTESLVLKLSDSPSVEEVAETLDGFRGEPQELGLPSAPELPIVLRTEEDRPQPVYDVFAGTPERARGMATTVGRLRESHGYYKAFALSHNTLRGGAGGSILNAEYAYRKNLI